MNTEQATSKTTSREDIPLNKKISVAPFDHCSFAKLKEPVSSEMHSIPAASITVLYNEPFSNHKGFFAKFRGKIIDHRRLLEELKKSASGMPLLVREKSDVQVVHKKRRPIHLIRLPSCKVPTPESALNSADKVLNKRGLVFDFKQNLAKIERKSIMETLSKTPCTSNTSGKPKHTNKKYLFDLYNKLLIIEKEKVDAPCELSSPPRLIRRRYSSVRRDLGGGSEFGHSPPRIRVTTRARDSIRIVRMDKPPRHQSNLRDPRKLVMDLNKLIHRQYEGVDETLNDLNVCEIIKT
eukprot:TRINITY_DN4405_c0_g3_i2.p1 TRINITY_DN4405_c0_g3~~TRINITY_DN4405_c0_g3_i2.p1  ORF type:complete len:294 (-),score=53.49 TRINITY_DN4405_c0_g3_i2:111-992(-)